MHAQGLRANIGELDSCVTSPAGGAVGRVETFVVPARATGTFSDKVGGGGGG